MVAEDLAAVSPVRGDVDLVFGDRPPVEAEASRLGAEELDDGRLGAKATGRSPLSLVAGSRRQWATT